MAKKGLVFKGEIIEIHDKKFDVYRDFTWVDVDSNIEVGDLFDGSIFSKKPVLLERIPTDEEKRRSELPSQDKLQEALIEAVKALSDGKTVPIKVQQVISAAKVTIDKYPSVKLIK